MSKTIEIVHAGNFSAKHLKVIKIQSGKFKNVSSTQKCMSCVSIGLRQNTKIIWSSPNDFGLDQKILGFVL